MVYKYECNAMRKGSSFLPHSSVQLSASAESRQQSVCVCRRAQLFFYLGAKERERKVTRLLTWPLIAGTNTDTCTKKHKLLYSNARQPERSRKSIRDLLRLSSKELT